MSAPSVQHLPELIAILAHDLRNPLSALLTNIHFVQSIASGSRDVDEALADSALSCSVLGQMIGNLEVLGRAFAGVCPPATPVGTREAAAQAMARAASQAALAGVDPVLESASPGATVLVEPIFFGRALDNLLANAFQYAPAKTKVTIDLVTAGDRAAVRVIDQGPIVPPEFRDRVLTEEGQGEAKKRYEARYGRGLGLYSAGQAAHMAGAELVLGEHEGRALAALWSPLAP